MMLELYLFLAGWTILMFILSIFKRDAIILLWIPVALAFITATASYNVEKEFCELNTSSAQFQCYSLKHVEKGLALLWYGLGFVFLAYAAIETFGDLFKGW